MTRTVSLSARAGHLVQRQLSGQHVAVNIVEVPYNYSDEEAFVVARAVADGQGFPLPARITWNELLAIGLQADLLAFDDRPRRPIVRRMAAHA